MLPPNDYEYMVRLHSRALARYIEQMTIAYINDILEMLYDFIFPLLYILYYNPHGLITYSREF